MDLEAISLELARDPAPAGRRLDRDRSQLPLPLDRPVTEPLTRRLKPALAQLARLRVEHHRLKHPLVDIDACVQHLPGPPFVTEVGPRTYRGRWRPPPLHPHESGRSGLNRRVVSQTRCGLLPIIGLGRRLDRWSGSGPGLRLRSRSLQV